MELPLYGTRILELGASEAAGIAGLLLSDLGAEVIRIDTPPQDGEALANADAVTFGLAAGEDRLCDRGKKRVFLDPRDPARRSLLFRLLETCGGVLDGQTPTEALGLDSAAPKARFPGLVYVRVTGYGASGPLADRPWSEAAVQAESGFVSTTGAEGGEPVRSGGDMASFLGGLTACIGMLMGLLERRRNPAAPGRRVDVSMMDAILFGLENQFSLCLKSGVAPKPKGNRYALSAPVGNFLCGDGKEIMISVATDAQWRAFAEALHKEAWLTRPEFSSISSRIENDELLAREVSGAFAQYTREELMEILQSRACVYGCINDFPAVLAHPQAAARHMFQEVTGTGGGTVTAPADPLMRSCPPEKRVIHAPGADTAEILEQ